MTRLFTYAAIMLGLSATAMLSANYRPANSVQGEIQLSADGAFRDGLYLGRLAAESGQPIHPAIGRWSAEQDRANFIAGYRRGYAMRGTSNF